MSAQDAAWQAGKDACEVLAPEAGILARLDPADFGASVLSVLARVTSRPAEVGAAWLRFGTALARTWPAGAARSRRRP